MARDTGPGLFHSETQGDTTYYLLYNFDIDRAIVKQEHVQKLNAEVLPFIRRGDFLFMLGLASRTAGPAHNLRLSGQRVRNVVDLLKPTLLTRGAQARLDWVGELLMPGPDEREDERFRAVAIARRSLPIPPPPNVHIDLPPPLDVDDEPPPRLRAQPVYKVAVLSGFEAAIPAPIPLEPFLAEFLFIIWDVVRSRAAIYSTGRTLGIGLSFPSIPVVATLRGEFASFTPGKFISAGAFGGPFELNRFDLATDSGAQLFITARVPGVFPRIHIPNLQMGPSVPPSVAGASHIHGTLSLVSPVFDYHGE